MLEFSTETILHKNEFHPVYKIAFIVLIIGGNHETEF
jgi:hypothetical protein